MGIATTYPHISIITSLHNCKAKSIKVIKKVDTKTNSWKRAESIMLAMYKLIICRLKYRYIYTVRMLYFGATVKNRCLSITIPRVRFIRPALITFIKSSPYPFSPIIVIIAVIHVVDVIRR